MSSALLLALSLTAAALAGVVVVELTTGNPAPAARLAPRTSEGAPALQPTDERPQHVAALLARPPFSPSRRPDAALGGDDPRLPHLTGILVTAQDRWAIFAGRDGGRGLVVKPGDAVGSYRVLDIGKNDVMLAGADGPHSVHPTFSAAPPPASPGAAPVMGLPLPQIAPPPAATLGVPAGPGAGSPR